LSTFRKNWTIDPFCLYLYGLVLKEKGSENLARTVLVESVNSYPWNWNAWSELQSLCTTIDILNSLNLNNHWMKDFFLAGTYHELRMHSESLTQYEYLQSTFSFINYIQAQIAKAQYSLREFEQVEVIFEELLRIDPYPWTLMGHEYVEMKNTPAAVDAYRRTVDINPCDYRACAHDRFEEAEVYCTRLPDYTGPEVHYSSFSAVECTRNYDNHHCWISDESLDLVFAANFSVFAEASNGKEVDGELYI
ncbi:hypothetical protein Dsin_005567, partial [Dipteronia sinensis]